MALEQTVAELILKIIADSTEVRKALQDVAQGEKKLVKDSKDASLAVGSSVDKVMDKTQEQIKRTQRGFESFGYGLRKLSSSLMIMGTMISAPFIASINVAAKTNAQIRLAMLGVTSSFRNLSEEIGNAALPLIEKFSEAIRKLVKWFVDLPPEVKKNIVQFSLLIGITLTLIGSVVRLIYMLKIVGALDALKTIITFLIINFKLLSIILGSVVIAFAAWKVGIWISDITGLNEALSGKNGLFTKIFEWLDKNNVLGKLKEFAATIGSLAIRWSTGMGFIPPEAIDLGKITVTPPKTVKKEKSPFGKMMDELGAGFKVGILNIYKEFTNFGAAMENGAKTIAMGMKDSFSTIFFDAFTGELKKAQEYFTAFGRIILKVLAEILAQILVVRTLRTVLPSSWFGIIGSEHEGGTIGPIVRKAHSGLSTGEVPVIAQTGEGYLSRNGMATLGSKGLDSLNRGEAPFSGGQKPVVVFIQSWDVSDVWRNRKVFEGIISNALKSNSPLRGDVKRYG